MLINFQKARTGIVATMLTGLGVLGLAACGGEASTATPIAGTPTTAAMSTATTAMTAPTATTGTRATATMGSAATATTGTARATATTAMNAPTATMGSGTGDQDALDLIQAAGEAMQDVKMYHLSMNIDAGDLGTTTAEGDMELPNKARFMLETAGQSIEMIIIDDKSYTRSSAAGDQYIVTPADKSLLTTADPSAMTALAQDAEIVGDETIDGTDTTHLKYSYDANAAAEEAGTAVEGTDLGTADVDMWIEKDTNYIKRVRVVSTAADASSTTEITYSKIGEPISPPIEAPTNIMELPTP